MKSFPIAAIKEVLRTLVEASVDTGVADATSTVNQLDDSAKSWPVNAFTDLIVEITAGTGEGDVRKIDSNTATRLVPVTAFTTAPDATSQYRIGFYGKITSVAKVSGETVALQSGTGPILAKVSGDTVVVASGPHVMVSGQMFVIASGTGPILAKVSGDTVVVASGPHVMVSGQMVQVASGTGPILAKISGEALALASGTGPILAKVSGDTVVVASGPHVMVSGQMVQVASGTGPILAKISGTVSIETPTAIKTGSLLVVTAASGGTIVTSGAVKSAIIKSLSGDVFVGGAGAGQMPYSGHGFLMAYGEATSLDIDNFGRARVCANTSGDWVTFMGVV